MVKADGETTPKLLTRTYDLPFSTAGRLKATARRYRVSMADLAGFLLTWALDQVDSGALAIPTKEGSLRVIDYQQQTRGEWVE